jgi:hypothetical protein
MVSINVLYVFLISAMHATCPTYVILHVITLIIFGEKYILWRSSFNFINSECKVFGGILEKSAEEYIST